METSHSADSERSTDEWVASTPIGSGMDLDDSAMGEEEAGNDASLNEVELRE